MKIPAAILFFLLTATTGCGGDVVDTASSGSVSSASGSGSAGGAGSGSASSGAGGAGGSITFPDAGDGGSGGGPTCSDGDHFIDVIVEGKMTHFAFGAPEASVPWGRLVSGGPVAPPSPGPP